MARVGRKWRICLLSTVALAAWIWYNLHVVAWRKENFTVEKLVLEIKDLPMDLNGTTIVQLSDIHSDREECRRHAHLCDLSMYISDEALDRVVNTVNELAPDLVALTGDFVVISKEGIHHAAKILKRITAPKVAVLGNHDSLDWPDANAYIRRNLEALGITVLVNEHAFPLGKGLAVVGLGDAWSSGPRCEPAIALRGIPPATPRLVLSHQPDTFAQLQSFRCDLVLSGHTHGGQFTLPLVGHVFPYYARFMKSLPDWLYNKMPHGMRDHGHWPKHFEWLQGLHSLPRSDGHDNIMYVNRGLGSNSGMRFRCDPEVTHITLVAAGGLAGAA